jgi:hypothetical protein
VLDFSQIGRCVVEYYENQKNNFFKEFEKRTLNEKLRIVNDLQNFVKDENFLTNASYFRYIEGVIPNASIIC